MLHTTVGQLLVNDALPEDLRDHHRVLDKKGLSTLLQEVARQHPDKYRDVSFRLNQIGQRAAQDQGGLSFGLQHLRRSKAANEIRQRIQQQLAPILADKTLTDKQRNERIIRVVGNESGSQIKAVLDEAIAAGNPLGTQVLSGTRGKPMNLASLLGSDMLYSDHRDEVLPIPVLRSYSEGLTPEEYWAGTYGARRGIIATKFATQEAGFLSKQLNQAGHRLVVMGEEGEEDPDAPTRGMVVDTGDKDNEGTLLARDTGPYKRNTPLTPKILKHLERLGKNRILIRSPLVGGSPEGGVYARDVGIRENGTLPGRGEQVGLQAAQALAEPVSQGMLSAKHSGGVAGQEKSVGGFQYLNQLIQVPKKMQGGAAHATVDGMVQRVEPAAAGGHYVTINDQKHYVGEGFDVKVKKGDQVEAGDMLSDGIPNPALITQYKGVGEGRRYFVNEFRKALASSGIQGHRRNIELLARGLINHVQLTDEMGDHAPDDIIPYSTLEHTYKPRPDHERLAPKKALGHYLERPMLHYTIGTKVRPSMLKDFEEFGVHELPVHKNPPPFQPHMVRGMYQLQHDPDWMTQMYGSGLKHSLLESTARGAVSEERGTSFIPSLATGNDFGEVADRAVVQPKAPYALPKVEIPEIPELPPVKAATFFGGRFKVAMESTTATPAASRPPATTPIPSPVKAQPSPSSAHDPVNPNIMPDQTHAAAPAPNAGVSAISTLLGAPAATAAYSEQMRASQNEWNRIHSYTGFQPDEQKLPHNTTAREVALNAQRTNWYNQQMAAYDQRFGKGMPGTLPTSAAAATPIPTTPKPVQQDINSYDTRPTQNLRTSYSVDDTDLDKHAFALPEGLQRSLLGAGLGAGAGYLGHRLRELVSPAEDEETQRRRRNLSLLAGTGLGAAAGYGTRPAKQPDIPFARAMEREVPIQTTLDSPSAMGLIAPPYKPAIPFADAIKQQDPVETTLPQPSSALWNLPAVPSFAEAQNTEQVSPLPLTTLPDPAAMGLHTQPTQSLLPVPSVKDLAWNLGESLGLNQLGARLAPYAGTTTAAVNSPRTWWSVAKSAPKAVGRFVVDTAVPTTEFARGANFAGRTADLARNAGLAGRAAKTVSGLASAGAGLGAQVLYDSAGNLVDLMDLYDDGTPGWDRAKFDREQASRGYLNQAYHNLRNLPKGITSGVAAVPDIADYAWKSIWGR